MSIFALAAIFVTSAICSLLATGILLPWLRRQSLLDAPNERSSHTSPTLLGGGIAVTLVLSVFTLFLSLNPFAWSIEVIGFDGVWLVVGMLCLAIVSWLDDIRGVSQPIRLTVHIVVVALLLVTLFEEEVIFQGLVPAWLDRILSVLLWVWFINLFNFMDGIDGISGVETLSIGIGLTLLAGSISWEPLGQTYAMVVAGAGLGFLWWNWHPAKVFLGDVGSVPLGFLLGWLLLNLAANGFWLQALILPLYYLVDSTLTLLERLSRGEKIWEAHRSHYYQQAVQKGLSHAQVSKSILIGNAVLIGLAVTSTFAPVTGMVGAVAVVFVMLLYFKQKPQA